MNLAAGGKTPRSLVPLESACSTLGSPISRWAFFSSSYPLRLAVFQSLADLTNRLALPEAAEIFQGCQRSRVHAIPVQPPRQVVDLVLQNPRVPSGRFDHP